MGLSPETVKRNKEGAGSYISYLRKSHGLTQGDLALLVGIEHYTMISSYESGRVTVPPSSYRPLAQSLRVDPREFTVRMLAWNEPQTYAGLFDNMDVEVAVNFMTRVKPRFQSAGRTGTTAYDDAIQLMRQLLQDGGWTAVTMDRAWELVGGEI